MGGRETGRGRVTQAPALVAPRAAHEALPGLPEPNSRGPKANAPPTPPCFTILLGGCLTRATGVHFSACVPCL